MKLRACLEQHTEHLSTQHVITWWTINIMTQSLDVLEYINSTFQKLKPIGIAPRIYANLCCGSFAKKPPLSDPSPRETDHRRLWQISEVDRQRRARLTHTKQELVEKDLDCPPMDVTSKHLHLSLFEALVLGILFSSSYLKTPTWFEINRRTKTNAYAWWANRILRAKGLLLLSSCYSVRDYRFLKMNSTFSFVREIKHFWTQIHKPNVIINYNCWSGETRVRDHMINRYDRPHLGRVELWQ